MNEAMKDASIRDVDFGGEDAVSFSRVGYAGVIRLTRPKALNALTRPMVNAMERALLHWMDDPAIAHVIIEGEGRAFCAGGDVVAAYHAGKRGQPDYAFFADEYRLNRLIGAYPKPYIALLDGIVMGGGAGISIHGSHRVVTENTRFAMPESAIGFFTDVGASVFLSRIAGQFGLYLGLTGSAIRWGDCLQCGLATHAVRAEQLPELRQKLIKSDDIAALFGGKGADDFAFAHPAWETLPQQRDMIAHCFAHRSVEHCLGALQQASDEGDPQASAVLAQLMLRSPTSLKAIFALLRDAADFIGANPDLTMSGWLDRQMQIEYALLKILLNSHDFYAGVGAVLIDKTGQPQWQPELLRNVTQKWEPVLGQ